MNEFSFIILALSSQLLLGILHELRKQKKRILKLGVDGTRIFKTQKQKLIKYEKVRNDTLIEG